jgi:hypothetical protein
MTMIDARREVGSPATCGAAIAVVVIAIVLAALFGDSQQLPAATRGPSVACHAKDGAAQHPTRCRPPSAERPRPARADAGDEQPDGAGWALGGLLLLVTAAGLAGAGRRADPALSPAADVTTLPTCAFPIGELAAHRASAPVREAAAETAFDGGGWQAGCPRAADAWACPPWRVSVQRLR